MSTFPAPSRGTSQTTPLLSRREVIAWMLAATVVPEVSGAPATAAGVSLRSGSGYGLDPDLLKVYRPGDVWPLTLNAAQHRTVVALCELILPADGEAPSAVAVGVPAFIDEWISSPYPEQRPDRTLLIEGFAWMDDESKRRHGRAFADLTESEQKALCDALCDVGKAPPSLQKGAVFFRRMRHLVAGGYYTTPEGMKDLGYVGNVPEPTFEGPPPEVLQRLGLA